MQGKACEWPSSVSGHPVTVGMMTICVTSEQTPSPEEDLEMWLTALKKSRMNFDAQLFRTCSFSEKKLFLKVDPIAKVEKCSHIPNSQAKTGFFYKNVLF